MAIRIFAAISFFCLALIPSLVKSDWINLTGAETSPNIAEIYVMDDHIKLVLEIYVGNLDTFDELIPDDWLKEIEVKRPQIEDRLQAFANEKFQFITDTNEKLPAQLTLAEPRLRVDRKSLFAGMINPYTRQRVPEAPEDKRVMYVEISYPFETKPKTLTIIPPLDEEGRALVSLGFIAYHKSVPIIDFRYLGAPAKLNLDWDDPWYSKFNNPNLKRHHKSALMSYLYVEPYEVRHEILTRVKDLEEWMDLGLRGDEYLELDELEPLKQRIGEFMLMKNAVRIDGKMYKPILDRTNYVKVALTGIQLLEQPERLEISTAIVGVIITYITDGLPQQVTVDWELFTEQVQQVPATATDPAGPFLSYVTPDDNQLIWNNFLKNYQVPRVEEIIVSENISRKQMPVITVLCVLVLIIMYIRIFQGQPSERFTRKFLIISVVLIGIAVISYRTIRISIPVPGVMAASLSNEEGSVLINGLLKNVYRAFDFREEGDIYDKLALSISGDLLEEIYLQNRQSFAIKKAGGAQAKIKEVEVINVDTERVKGQGIIFRLNTKWTAMGTVGHWGHVHMRKNYYDALITVSGIDGHWKITGLDLLEEKRIEPYGQSQQQLKTEQNDKNTES